MHKIATELEMSKACHLAQKILYRKHILKTVPVVIITLRLKWPNLKFYFKAAAKLSWCFSLCILSWRSIPLLHSQLFCDVAPQVLSRVYRVQGLHTSCLDLWQIPNWMALLVSQPQIHPQLGYQVISPSYNVAFALLTSHSKKGLQR